METKLGARKHYKKTLECLFCEKKFLKQREFYAHICSVHIFEKCFWCDDCDKTYSYRSGLLNHQLTHLGNTDDDKPHECTICSKRFLFLGNLQQHLRIHTAERHYSCDICGKRVSCSSSLKGHLQTHLPVGNREQHKCPLCPKKYPLRTNLLHHMKTHDTERKFKCEVCSKAFFNNRDLSIHTRIHTGERPYACRTCGVKVISLSKRWQHENSHKKKNEQVCKICGKVFFGQRALSRHIKGIHNKVNNNSCLFCDKQFPTWTQLQKHLCSHINERPLDNGEKRIYACRTCGRNFKSYSSRYQHENSHKYENEVCSICQKVLWGKRSLTAHVKKVHNKVKSEIAAPHY